MTSQQVSRRERLQVTPPYECVLGVASWMVTGSSFLCGSTTLRMLPASIEATEQLSHTR
jgi:hypothetical protein